MIAVSEVLGVGGCQQIEGQNTVGTAGGEPVGRIQLACGESQVRHDGSGLLAQADLVEAFDVVAGTQCRRGEHLIHRDDAGTADSGQEDVVGGCDGLDVKVGQHRGFGRRRCARLLARLYLDGDERRAVAVKTAVVGVAGGLVDPRLAAVLGVHRLYRQAVGLDAAVSAAFADRLVDDHPGVAGGQRAALTLPACVGRAVLVVDQHGHTLDVAQTSLRLVEAVAVPDDGALGERTLVVPLRFVGADDDLLDTFGREFVGQLRDCERALGVLGAGHRHDLVVEQFVGDVHAGRDTRLDGELSGVEEGSVTDVLEQVRLRR